MEYVKATRSKIEEKPNEADANEAKKTVKNKNEEKKREETATVVRKPLTFDQTNSEADITLTDLDKTIEDSNKQSKISL